MSAVAVPLPKVHLLDPHTVNQIAAGEVVERPASVVKELVENALDAGATKISIVLGETGRRLISVTDDGCGMSPEDTITCLQRHATSKIQSVEDLSRVDTLGFRGEAIPSIASVSRMRISSGELDGIRTLIEIEGGVVAPMRHESGPQGTTIVVEDLFFNTPARLKFLKTDSTELNQSIEIVSKYAVAYPSVSFCVTHNDSVILETNGSGDQLAALAELWGRDVAKSLAELDTWVNGVRVRGFVSTPSMTRPNRAMQWLFVNGRPVRSRSLTASIDVAYRSLTPEKRYPVVVLMLDVDPAILDVNVSPTKTEVKFQHEGKAFDAIRVAIRQALLAHGMIPSAEAVFAANEALAQTRSVPVNEPGMFSSVSFLTQVQGSGGTDASIHAQRPGCGDPSGPTLTMVAQSLGHDESFSTPMAHIDALLDGLKIIGQLYSTFILAENRRGLLIIDQHVAHERILYEYLKSSRGKVKLAVQPLLSPETIHLGKVQAAAIRDRLEELALIGFELEAFGPESFLVRSVPADLRSKKPIQVLRDLIDELAESPVGGKLTPTREDVWILASCKMAIKAGDPLSHAEMEKLILDLAQTENPYLCPHGRPITIVMERDALLRKFKRS